MVYNSIVVFIMCYILIYKKKNASYNIRCQILRYTTSPIASRHHGLSLVRQIALHCSPILNILSKFDSVNKQSPRINIIEFALALYFSP